MLKLTCHIAIHSQNVNGIVIFKHVNAVEVTSSMDNFTDTAKLTLPRKVKYDGKDITNYIRRNDKITIQLGYDNNLETVFKGYVTSVSTGTPIVLECENEAWKLKKAKVKSAHYDSFHVKKFVDDQMKGYNVEIVDVNLGEVRINGETTLSRVFDHLSSNHPFKFFFRDDTFYGILSSSMMLKNDAIKTHKFKIGLNVINDNLTYTLAEDVEIQIVAKTILKKNVKLEWKEPTDKEHGGEIRTFLVPRAKTLAELKTFAKSMLATFKVDKMTGDFTTFGLPFVRKGDIVHLYDDKNYERNDKKFLVQEVQYSFGQSGYRQRIMLGNELK